MNASTCNVLLISLLRGSHRNLSCHALYAYLHKYHVHTKLLFIPLEDQYDPALLQAFIRQHNFEIIGLSVITEEYFFAKQITEDIRVASPNAHVIWGGIHPTLMPEECLTVADSVCIGEGEECLLQLARAIAEQKPLGDIQNHVTRNQSERADCITPVRMESLDAVPFNSNEWEDYYIQDRDGLRSFTHADYIRYSNYAGEDYTLMTSRSCPFSCSYCCNEFLNRLYGQRSIRKRSVEHVLAEIQNARERIPTIRFINFIDDHFLTSREWTEVFVERYGREVGLPFIIRLVPGAFNDETIQALSQVGLSFVQVGIQSGSAATHEQIFKRRFRREAILETSRILKRHNVHPFYDVIIQNQLEADADRDQTIQLLLELEQPFSLTLFALTPYPKTRLEQMFIERGIHSRTNPYKIGYADYDVSDPYFQLASVIPYIPHAIGWFLFRNLSHIWARWILSRYYKTFKDRCGKRITAQERNKQ